MPVGWGPWVCGARDDAIAANVEVAAAPLRLRLPATTPAPLLCVRWLVLVGLLGRAGASSGGGIGGRNADGAGAWGSYWGNTGQ
jgi:hypothetical protein